MLYQEVGIKITDNFVVNGDLTKGKLRHKTQLILSENTRTVNDFALGYTTL